VKNEELKKFIGDIRIKEINRIYRQGYEIIQESDQLFDETLDYIFSQTLLANKQDFLMKCLCNKLGKHIPKNLLFISKEELSKLINKLLVKRGSYPYEWMQKLMSTNVFVHVCKVSEKRMIDLNLFIRYRYSYRYSLFIIYLLFIILYSIKHVLYAEDDVITSFMTSNRQHLLSSSFATVIPNV
jgi:hypothetical protein